MELLGDVKWNGEELEVGLSRDGRTVGRISGPSFVAFRFVHSLDYRCNLKARRKKFLSNRACDRIWRFGQFGMLAFGRIWVFGCMGSWAIGKLGTWPHEQSGNMAENWSISAIQQLGTSTVRQSDCTLVK